MDFEGWWTVIALVGAKQTAASIRNHLKQFIYEVRTLKNMVECAKSGIYRKLMFLEEFLYWFGGFINKIERDIAGARKIFADQPADLLEVG